MEQLAPVIAWLKTNRFWIGCAALALLMGGVYYVAAGSANKARKARASEIDGLIRTVAGIKSTNATEVDFEKDDVRAHPNSFTEKGMEERIAKAEESAIKAWVIQYNKQKDLLAWPEKQINSKEFMDKIQEFTPAELGKDMPIDTFGELRDFYRDMLNDRMTELAKVVGTSWMFAPKEESKSDSEEGDGSQISAPAGGGSEAVPDGADNFDLNADVVTWNEDNQKLWRQKITEFRGDAKDQTRPTTYEILLLQEDLWVFESVLNIIAAVNKGADANDLADVKRIDHILIGREAYLDHSKTALAVPNIDAGKIDDGGEEAAKKPENFGKIGGSKKKAKRGKASRTPGQDSTGFDFKTVRDPSHGRYVDGDYNPIAAPDVVQGVNADKLTDYASLTVAKRIPVRVAVVMNEKQIGEFLAACANSPLTFEVRQVRINRHKPGDGVYIVGENASGPGGGGTRGKSGKDMKAPSTGGGVTAPSAGGGGGGEAATGGDFERSGGSDGGSGGGSVSGTSGGDARTNYDVMVEFYGIIKIYNPVKYKLLGSKKPAMAEDEEGKTGDSKKDADDKKGVPKAKP